MPRGTALYSYVNRGVYCVLAEQCTQRLTVEALQTLERGDVVGTAHLSRPLPYTGRLLPSRPTVDDVREALPDLAAIVVNIISYVAERYDRSPEPGWIDTKFHIVTGEDFAPDDVRGPGTVYGWIQGRALEALVGHADWIARHPWADPDGTLLPRLQRMIRELFARLEAVRSQNYGRLFFFLDPDGKPFTFAGRSGYRTNYVRTGRSPSATCSAAARCRPYLAIRTVHKARTYCLAVEDTIWTGPSAATSRNCPLRGAGDGKA